MDLPMHRLVTSATNVNYRIGADADMGDLAKIVFWPTIKTLCNFVKL